MWSTVPGATTPPSPGRRFARAPPIPACATRSWCAITSPWIRANACLSSSKGAEATGGSSQNYFHTSWGERRTLSMSTWEVSTGLITSPELPDGRQRPNCWEAILAAHQVGVRETSQFGRENGQLATLRVTPNTIVYQFLKLILSREVGIWIF